MNGKFLWIVFQGAGIYGGGLVDGEKNARDQIETQMKQSKSITKGLVFAESDALTKAEPLVVVWHDKK